MPETSRTETELIAPEIEMPVDVTLDPSDWPSLRKQSHAILDDTLDYIQNIRQRPPQEFSEQANLQSASQQVPKLEEPQSDRVGLLFKRGNILRLMGQDMEARKS